MWFHVDPSAGVPIYLQIVQQVKNAVAGEVLKAGDQLPSVRDLALQLTINPNTVARAYQELERDRVIYTQKGRGTFVAEPEITIIREERVKALRRTIRQLLVQAHHLGFDREDLEGILRESLGEWYAGRRTAVDGEDNDGSGD